MKAIDMEFILLIKENPQLLRAAHPLRELSSPEPELN